MAINPVDQAVIANGLIAAAAEMGVKLVRSAYSPIVREANDASAALLDRHGNVVAQAELIPMQLGPISATFRACADLIAPETLVEGDFYINNDPFQGGQHLPDVFLFSPIFHDGELVGFSATVAHHLDLGGGAPGLNMAATDVHQEGLIFPPSKYNLSHDWNGGPLERLIAANIRVPAQTIGDFNAQFAANSIGADRVQRLCGRFGAATVLTAMRELLEYSERRMRAAIGEAPDGVYQGEDALDDDGLSDTPLPVRATVTIDGDRVAVDFTGTCDQVKTNINCPFASTVAAALSCVKSVLTSPDIPYNEGSKRPIEVAAPFGSLLNPRPPAPVRARMLSGYRAFNAVMKALAQAVPEKVIAAGFDSTEPICLSKLKPEGYDIYLEIFGGGYGAAAHQDGCDAVDGPLSNCGNVPIEAIDMEHDYFRVEEYSLIPDSGGPGRYRGGMGFRRVYRVLEDDVSFASYSDRFTIPPEGLFGGAAGAKAATVVLRDGKEIPLGSKVSFALKKGDLLITSTGGGAGYGDVALRAAADLRRDLDEGFVNPAQARRVYGMSDAAE